MAKIRAYTRVSTSKQDLENQRLGILELANQRGLGKVEFIEEKVSGRKSWKDRAIAGIIEELGKGDVLLVSELSRLGRSMFEIVEILGICNDREITILAAKGGWVFNGTMQGKITGTVLAMTAEIERDLMSKRTKEALAARKAKAARGETWISKAGNVCHGLGRPRGPAKSKLDPRANEIKELLKMGVKKKVVAKKMGTTPENLRHWMKMRKITWGPE